VLFGDNQPQVAGGAAPALGSCTFRVILHGPSAGAPLPDLNELLIGCGDWSFIRVSFAGQANGTLPNGSAAMLQVTETGLLVTAGVANPNSRVALDGFPAEHIYIRAIGH